MPAASKQSAAPVGNVSAPSTARQSLSGLHPGQMAFLGEYADASENRQLFVQVLCWPTIPAAWSMLVQAHAGLSSQRGGMTALPAPKGSSWIHHVAPQLSQPLERDAHAAESTLATLIRRLPLRFAAAVIETGAAESRTSERLRYRDLFSQSLGAYSAHLQGANLLACGALIAAQRTAFAIDARRQVYGEVLPNLDNAARVEGMALIEWPETTIPLPLEIAQLAATTVGRHLQQPDAPSSLFETVRGHLVPSLRFPLNDSTKRRR